MQLIYLGEKMVDESGGHLGAFWNEETKENIGWGNVQQLLMGGCSVNIRMPTEAEQAEAEWVLARFKIGGGDSLRIVASVLM